MYTNTRLKKSCATFLIASIASFSVLAVGFVAHSETLGEVSSPFKPTEISETGEGFSLSGSGFIKSNSSPNYHQPQVTGKDNPYTEETVEEVITVELTGYSSTVDQTNSQPCITANGFNVCSYGRMGTVAANFLPFGTEIRIPEYFGDHVFVVRDRMNTRYNSPSSSYYQGYVDIWFPTRWEANNFGRVKGEIEILE